MKQSLVILSGLIAGAFFGQDCVHAFSKEYYEKKGFKFDKDHPSGGIGGTSTESEVAQEKIEHSNEEHERAARECEPHLLQITAYKDKECGVKNDALTQKAQLTEKQIKRFDECQPLSHGQNIYGKVDCHDDGFVINVFTDSECTKRAHKSGHDYKQQIYFGRCHREQEGGHYYFKVVKMSLREYELIKEAKNKAEGGSSFKDKAISFEQAAHKEKREMDEAKKMEAYNTALQNKEGKSASAEDKQAVEAFEREKKLKERKSDSMSTEMSEEYENGNKEDLVKRKQDAQKEKEKKKKEEVENQKGEQKANDAILKAEAAKQAEDTHDDHAAAEKPKDQVPKEEKKQEPLNVDKDKMYDDQTEQMIIQKAKEKNGLLSEEEKQKISHNKFQKQLDKEKAEREEKSHIEKVKQAAWEKYNNLGTNYHHTSGTNRVYSSILSSAVMMILLL